MDSLTHIAIGACIGVVVAKKLPVRTAVFWGALFQSLPDIDFVSALWNTQADQLLAHRGFTHSILFLLLATPLLALLAEKWNRRRPFTRRQWMFFAGLQLLVHILIDVLNVYGVGWFEPFSHQRLAFNWIFVADPFFTIVPLIVFLVLLLAGKKLNPGKWAVAGLLVPFFYLVYCGFNKWQTDNAAKALFKEQGIHYTTYFTTPSPFNNWLWYIVAKTDSGFYTGYRSVFDAPGTVQLQYRPQQATRLQPYYNREDLHALLRFSNGYYLAEMRNDSLLFCDLRFGEQMGWQEPQAPFVFYYYMQYPAQNALLVQRGRMAGWNKNTFNQLIDRIRGRRYITPAGNKK